MSMSKIWMWCADVNRALQQLSSMLEIQHSPPG